MVLACTSSFAKCTEFIDIQYTRSCHTKKCLSRGGVPNSRTQSGKVLLDLFLVKRGHRTRVNVLISRGRDKQGTLSEFVPYCKPLSKACFKQIPSGIEWRLQKQDEPQMMLDTGLSMEMAILSLPS